MPDVEESLEAHIAELEQDIRMARRFLDQAIDGLLWRDGDEEVPEHLLDRVDKVERLVRGALEALPEIEPLVIPYPPPLEKWVAQLTTDYCRGTMADVWARLPTPAERENLVRLIADQPGVADIEAFLIRLGWVAAHLLSSGKLPTYKELEDGLAS